MCDELKTTKTSKVQSGLGNLQLEGKISRLSSIQFELSDGTTVIAPESISINKETVGFVKDLIDIVCKFVKCGGGGDNDGGGGGGGTNCVTVITKDKTITICDNGGKAA